MHPVTRLGRVIQQLRSFSDLHAMELETLSLGLDEETATRLLAHRDIQRDETTMVMDELVDIQNALISEAEAAAEPAVAPPTVTPGDPAANSPKRAKWLAEQAAEAERLRQPVSRRTLFGRVAKPEDEAQ